MSSLEASPTFYQSEDWQLKSTEHSYESTKYQIDLIGTHLDRRALQSNASRTVRHFVTQPGVCSTNVSQALVGPFLDFFKVILFYLVRRFLLFLDLRTYVSTLGPFLWIASPYDIAFQGRNRCRTLVPRITCFRYAVASSQEKQWRNTRRQTYEIWSRDRSLGKRTSWGY